MEGIFDPSWTVHHRPVVDSAALSTVRVTRTDPSATADWSPETGLTTTGTPVVLYEGPARWQKVGRPTKRDFVEDSANFNTVRVQIPMDEVDAYREGKTLPEGLDWPWQPNDRVEMLVNESNPDSVGDVVYVWGDATSSNAWNHNLTCQQNMKQVG